MVPNILLIILLIVIPIAVAVVSLVVIILFSAPLDKWQAPLPKIIVILANTLGVCAVLILPFDVWNTTQKGNLDVALPYIWQILFGLIIFFVLVVLPFTYFYYESYDPDVEGVRGVLFQTLWGGVSAIILCVLAGIIVGVSYIFLGYAVVPVTTYVSDSGLSSFSQALAYPNMDCANCFYQYQTFEVGMSFVVYFTGIMSIAGWFVFVICGGCGMSALPLTCLLCICKKPKAITIDEYKDFQKQYAFLAQKLIDLGVEVNDNRKKLGRANRTVIRQFREFKQAVAELENDWNYVKTQYEDQGGSIFPYLFATIAGVFFIFLTIIWLVHMGIYMLPPFPVWGFLNIFFEVLDRVIFPVFGVTLYSIFALYLLVCIIFGNIQIASRLPLVSVFPIKYKDTLLNAFIFNAGLMLLAAITVIQFCLNAFSQYSRFTSIDAFFNVHIFYMKGIQYFFRYVHYALFVFIFLGAVITIIASFIPTEAQKRLAKLRGEIPKK